MELVRTVDPFEVAVDGVAVVVDHRTFTLAERRASRAALLDLSGGDQVAADEVDALAALVWTVLRRSDPTLTLVAVCESITLGDLAEARPVSDDVDKDDDPEV